MHNIGDYAIAVSSFDLKTEENSFLLFASNAKRVSELYFILSGLYGNVEECLHNLQMKGS